MKNKRLLFISLVSIFLFGCDHPITEGVNITSKGLEYEMYLNERVTESERPFIYIQYVEQKEDIAQDVVDQALLEHQIYLSTFENNG